MSAESEEMKAASDAAAKPDYVARRAAIVALPYAKPISEAPDILERVALDEYNFRLSTVRAAGAMYDTVFDKIRRDWGEKFEASFPFMNAVEQRAARAAPAFFQKNVELLLEAAMELNSLGRSDVLRATVAAATGE